MKALVELRAELAQAQRDCRAWSAAIEAQFDAAEASTRTAMLQRRVEILQPYAGDVYVLGQRIADLEQAIRHSLPCRSLALYEAERAAIEHDRANHARPEKGGAA